MTGETITSAAGLMGLPPGDGPRITTPEDRGAVAPGTVVRDAQGSIACRHPSGVGVVFGDERPFPWDRLALPMEVIWPRPQAAPSVSREQVEAAREAAVLALGAWLRARAARLAAGGEA